MVHRGSRQVGDGGWSEAGAADLDRLPGDSTAFDPALSSSGSACGSPGACRWPMYLAMLLLLVTPFLMRAQSSEPIPPQSPQIGQDRPGLVEQVGPAPVGSPGEEPDR